MDHRFSKREYFINCSLTLFFCCLVAASYFDISTCPYLYVHKTSYSNSATETLTGSSGGSGGAEKNTLNNSKANSNLFNYDNTDETLQSHKNLINVLFPSTKPEKEKLLDFEDYFSFDEENGVDEEENKGKRRGGSSRAGGFGGGSRLTCHMVDLIVWAYVIGFIVFMVQKFIYYKSQGMHYFFLDYCYFHNVCLVFFLLWRLVDVEYDTTQPILSWSQYFPESWQPYFSDRHAQPNLHPLHRHSATPAGNNVYMNATNATAGAAALTAKSWMMMQKSYLHLPGALYRIKRVQLLTVTYVASNLSLEELVSSFMVFFMLFAGTLGPILGAILMWKNALLFHSFDRMSSCYLHLFPAIIQILLLHLMFVTARAELRAVDPKRLIESALVQLADNKKMYNMNNNNNASFLPNGTWNGSSSRVSNQTGLLLSVMALGGLDNTHMETLVPGLYAMVRTRVTPFLKLVKEMRLKNKKAASSSGNGSGGGNLTTKVQHGLKKIIPKRLKGSAKIFYDFFKGENSKNDLEDTFDTLFNNFNFSLYEDDFHFTALSPAEQMRLVQLYTKYAQRYELEALCGTGTLCYDLKTTITFPNLFGLHFLMFAVWQLFYHTFNECRRTVREKRFKKNMEAIRAQERLLTKYAGVPQDSEDLALLRDPITVNEGAGGDITKRVTAYTWMMEHPPGGFKGLPYRFVTCLGKGRLQTTILFQFSQLICHFLFLLINYYLAIYPAFHVVLSAWPLCLLLLGFLGLTIYNAACMDKRWIKKLQSLADQRINDQKKKEEEKENSPRKDAKENRKKNN